MRIEPFAIDSIVHITKRGTRGLDIVRDQDDKLRFTKSLFLLNDTYSSPNWHRESSELPVFARPESWPEQDPLVHILGWTLLSNHFHLLVREIRDKGISTFMQRLGGSMSMCFNLKYKERGSIFQSAYHARAVHTDEHIRYLAFYILAKNTLEMYPYGGLSGAASDFDEAWKWAKKYPFSSLKDFVSGNKSPIINDEDDLLTRAVRGEHSFKIEVQELLVAHLTKKENEFREIALEPW
jgi:hypothetical protein